MNEPIDWYQLFLEVNVRGGWKSIEERAMKQASKSAKWKAVKATLPNFAKSTPLDLKRLYERYLKPLEDHLAEREVVSGEALDQPEQQALEVTADDTPETLIEKGIRYIRDACRCKIVLGLDQTVLG